MEEEEVEEEEEEEEEEPKRPCYSLIKLTKEIRTPQQESKKHTKIIQQQNDNKQTQYYFIPSQQLCQNKNWFSGQKSITTKRTS